MTHIPCECCGRREANAAYRVGDTFVCMCSPCMDKILAGGMLLLCIGVAALAGVFR